MLRSNGVVHHKHLPDRKLYHHGEPLQTTALVSFRSLISVLSATLARTSKSCQRDFFPGRSELLYCLVRYFLRLSPKQEQYDTTSKKSIRATTLAVNLSYPVVNFGCEQDSLSAATSQEPTLDSCLLLTVIEN